MLERLQNDQIPDDLSEHWSALQVWAGAGNLHTSVGLREEHQRTRLTQVVEAAAELGVESCLEVGCCEGAMTAELAKHFRHVVAIDFLQSLIDQCPELPNVRYELMDIETKVPAQPFEVAVLSEVLEHLRDPRGAIARVFEISDYIVASCPTNEELVPDAAWDVELLDALGTSECGIGHAAGHLWAMDEDGFRSMFDGYEIVSEVRSGPSLIVVAHA